jgi:hypothetical protein
MVVFEGRRWLKRPRCIAGSIGDSGASATPFALGSNRGSGACPLLYPIGPLRPPGRDWGVKGRNPAGGASDTGFDSGSGLNVLGICSSILAGDSIGLAFEGLRDSPEASDAGGLDLELAALLEDAESSDAPESDGV